MGHFFNFIGNYSVMFQYSKNAPRGCSNKNLKDGRKLCPKRHKKAVDFPHDDLYNVKS